MRAGALPPPPDLPFAVSFDPETGLPLGPSAAEWLSLSPEQREALEWWLMDAYAAWEEANLAPEGTDHADAQRDLFDRLRGHFDRRRRGVFLATNLLVQYPEAVSFAPDLMAVMDAPLHARSTWVVTLEGKGPDFVLEFLHNGDRRKDLVRNVALLARLGVPEYFVFDARRNTLHGWRLPQPDAALYQPILPQRGFWTSEVLGLELTVLEGEVRAYRDGDPVLGSGERIELMGRLMAEAQSASKAAAEQAAEAQRRAEEEARRADAITAQNNAALGGLRALVRTACGTRGWTLTAVQQARLDACDDPNELVAWAIGAATATDAEALFDTD